MFLGSITPHLFWFKTKEMKSINPLGWDIYKKGAAGYYATHMMRL